MNIRRISLAVALLIGATDASKIIQKNKDLQMSQISNINK
jgi:hypothetical protein